MTTDAIPCTHFVMEPSQTHPHIVLLGQFSEATDELALLFHGQSHLNDKGLFINMHK